MSNEHMVMFDGRVGSDPYVIYKIHHAERARMAWWICEEIGLYEALRDKPLSVDEVRKALNLEYRPIAILLAANACMGILGVRDGRYYIYDQQRDYVLKDGRARRPVRPPAPGESQWYDLHKNAVLKGEPTEEGLPEWIQDPGGSSVSEAFDPKRDGWRIMWGESLAGAFDFSSYRTVLDLGGSTGGLLTGLTGYYPNLRGLVLDLPYSRRSAEAAIDLAGASNRVRFVPADFFKDPYPDDTDVIVMSHVIHDWDDSNCLRILKRCYDALPDGHPVIVQEFLLNEDKTGPTLAVFQWFGLLRGTMGDQRTASEISALLAEVGFRHMETRPIDKEQSIVIGWKKPL